MISVIYYDFESPVLCPIIHNKKFSNYGKGKNLSQ
jgi:hypothetical protein